MALGGEAPESCGINARATHANPTLSAKCALVNHDGTRSSAAISDIHRAPEFVTCSRTVSADNTWCRTGEIAGEGGLLSELRVQEANIDRTAPTHHNFNSCASLTKGNIRAFESAHFVSSPCVFRCTW